MWLLVVSLLRMQHAHMRQPSQPVHYSITSSTARMTHASKMRQQDHITGLQVK